MKSIHVWKDEEPFLWLEKMPTGGVGVFCGGSLLSRLYRPWTIKRALNQLRLTPEEITTRNGYSYNLREGGWEFRIPPQVEPTIQELAALHGITAKDHDEHTCYRCRWKRIASKIPYAEFPNMRLVNAWKSFSGQTNPSNAFRDGISHELVFGD